MALISTPWMDLLLGLPLGFAREKRLCSSKNKWMRRLWGTLTILNRISRCVPLTKRLACPFYIFYFIYFKWSVIPRSNVQNGSLTDACKFWSINRTGHVQAKHQSKKKGRYMFWILFLWCISNDLSAHTVCLHESPVSPYTQTWTQTHCSPQKSCLSVRPLSVSEDPPIHWDEQRRSMDLWLSS